MNRLVSWLLVSVLAVGIVSPGRADLVDIFAGRGKGPKLGEAAPDFALSDLQGQGSPSLSARYADGPVALIFGSFTWGPFCREAGRLEGIHQRFREDVNFLFVYIREAHPRAGRTFRGTRVVPKRIYGNGAVSEPRNAAERRAVARLCVETLGLTMPTVIDDLQNSVARAYRGWPERLFLIDRLGRVRFATAPGPAGFSPSALERAIEGHLAQEVTSGEHRE